VGTVSRIVEASLLAERYQLVSVLGRGGMGDVWLACDQRLQRDVAIKVLRPELAAEPRVRQRFEDEARAAAQLTHPNVVTVYDTGDDDGTPFIVMERLSGRTLADVVREGDVSLEQADRWADEILAAVAAAHGAGVLHRDIKPGNVLLAADGSVKVADFGIAKIADDVDATTTGVVLGTPAYLAPERLAGHPATPASDIFGVGVVLYELLSGHCPFPGDNPMAIAHAIQQGEIVPLRQRRPEVDPAMAAALERAMSVDPDDRFSSAAAMGAAVRSAAAPAPPAAAADTVALPVQPVHATMALPTLAPRRSRAPLAWVAVIVALVVLGVGVLFVARDSGGASGSPGQTTVTQPSTPSVTVIGADLDAALRELEKAVQP
jgi:serine/threonine protein kinase